MLSFNPDNVVLNMMLVSDVFEGLGIGSVAIFRLRGSVPYSMM